MTQLSERPNSPTPLASRFVTWSACTAASGRAVGWEEGEPYMNGSMCLTLGVLSLAAVATLAIAAADTPAGAGGSVVAPGAKLQMLAGEFKFTEGPASDAEGNVFFTDQPNDRIMKWSTDGKLSTFKSPCGRSNGLCFDGQGNLIACADEQNQLWSIDPSGKATVLVKDYQGKLLNGPNDVWVRPDGGIYFTDPFYKRDYWKRGPQEQDKRCVY